MQQLRRTKGGTNQRYVTGAVSECGYFSVQHIQSNNQNFNEFQYKRYFSVGKRYNKWPCMSNKNVALFLTQIQLSI